MHNDSGNSPKVYGLNQKGTIIKELKIDSKNKDWEDLTSDKNGNLYVGDFGNNENKRKKLSILKIKKEYLQSDSLVPIERISFYYPNQKQFPPKKKQQYFDSEAFFHFNDSLYIFTKSRVKGDYGATSVYKIPAIPGNHAAVLIDTFKTCDGSGCWITSADISNDGKKVVLLTPNVVWLFTDFKADHFFKGNVTPFPLDISSQKEGICFKNNTTLYISDEKSHNRGGNLYEFKLETED